MLDKVARERIAFHLDSALLEQECLTARLRRAKDAFLSFSEVVRQNLPRELVAASKAAYEAADHIDRAGEAWEAAVE
jgi:hypothetical protein